MTSFVPSGNMASTWTIFIISGTPVITSSRFRIVAPYSIMSVSIGMLPSRARSRISSQISAIASG